MYFLDLTKDSVFVIQIVELITESNKKLTTIRIWLTSVCHRNSSFAIMTGIQNIGQLNSSYIDNLHTVV